MHGKSPYMIISQQTTTPFQIKVNIIDIIIKKGRQCKAARESDIHPISPTTPAPQYQPIDRKKRMEKE